MPDDYPVGFTVGLNPKTLTWPYQALRMMGVRVTHYNSKCNSISRTVSLPRHIRITNRSLSREASEGWIDLTKLVTGGGSNKGPYDELASEIGKQVMLMIPPAYCVCQNGEETMEILQ
jgi:hypothetical protein